MTDLHKAAEQALDELSSVLCDPEGNVCCEGSEVDRMVIGLALADLREALAKPVVPDAVREEINGQFNACMFRDHCRAMIAATPQPKEKP